MVERQSASTVLLLASVGLLLASTVNLFPWGLFVQLWSAESEKLATPELVLFWLKIAALFVGALIFCALTYQQRQRSEEERRQSSLVELAQVEALAPFLAKLRALPGFAQTEFRLLGNPERAPDSGGPLNDTPRAMRASSAGGKPPNLVLIPPKFWQRFQAYPEALAAVLTHELAHIGNWDIALLFDCQRALSIYVGVAVFSFVSSVVSSVLTDADAFSGDALLAALVGKNYLFVVCASLALTIFVVRRMHVWREALADAHALRIFGAAALRTAERLLADSDPDLPMPTAHLHAPDHKRAYILTPPELLLLGCVTVATVNYLLAPLPFLASLAQPDGVAQVLLLNAALIIMRAGTFILYFFALAAVFREAFAGALTAGRAIWLMMLLALGALLSQLLLQTLPLIVTSVGMPARFDFIERVYPGPALLSAIFGSSSFAANWLLFAGATAFLYILSGQIFRGLVPGAVWILFAAIECHVVPTWLEGWLAVLLTAVSLIVMALPVLPALLTRLHALPPTLVLLVFFSAINWLGYGDIGHLASCSSQAGIRHEEANRHDKAIASVERAVGRSQPHPEAFLQLARLLMKDQAALSRAARTAEQALAAPYLQSWSTRFTALGLAGELRLSLHTPEDLAIARKYFADAEAMWRQNSRIPALGVAQALYNQACVLALLEPGSPSAAAHLLESLTVADVASPAASSRLAKLALQDSDLASLDLNHQSYPQVETRRLISSGMSSAQQLEQAVQDGRLSTREVIRFVAHKTHELANLPRS